MGLKVKRNNKSQGREGLFDVVCVFPVAAICGEAPDEGAEDGSSDGGGDGEADQDAAEEAAEEAAAGVGDGDTQPLAEDEASALAALQPPKQSSSPVSIASSAPLETQLDSPDLASVKKQLFNNTGFEEGACGECGKVVCVCARIHELQATIESLALLHCVIAKRFCFDAVFFAGYNS